MSWLIGTASVMMSLFIVIAISPFGSEVNPIFLPLLILTYMGLIYTAECLEYKLEKRIDILEKKIKELETINEEADNEQRDTN